MLSIFTFGNNENLFFFFMKYIDILALLLKSRYSSVLIVVDHPG